MDKYLSIITNFGCHYTCPYCIVKNNNLHIPKTTIGGLEKLPEAIKEHKVNWVSISGGGDPLFDARIHSAFDGWYDKLFDMIPVNIRLELHTSYTIHDNYMESICHGFNRVVYHSHNIWDICNVTRYKEDQIVRVVFVVTEDFTPEKINDIVRAVKMNPNIDELSFRQMVDENYETTHYCEEYLKAGHKKDWYYIEQNDYNIYYCENEVSYRYRDFEKVRE